ncbi:hypothetical protein N431DRAFT_180474 [Stipitochalara longipes BDJ]|nr:hypothetical protein N431DRAFT_180474 [Stipitochalara longipes BDJ]
MSLLLSRNSGLLDRFCVPPWWLVLLSNLSFQGALTCFCGAGGVLLWRSPSWGSICAEWPTVFPFLVICRVSYF